MQDLSVIFAGAGEFGLPSLRAIVDAGSHIVQVVSQPDRPAGRGRKLTPTAISQFAIEHGLPLIRTLDINSESLPPADVMVVIAFGQKIAEPVVNRPRLGSVNLHSSRLPKFRGAAPINAAILAGETETGNSIIRLAAKMDAGAILSQSRLSIGETETAGELHDRLADDGALLMIQTLSDLSTGRATETEQDHSLATLAPKLSREKTKLDWTGPAEELSCSIRGMFPWPGCRVRITDQDGSELDRVTLVRAKALAGTPSAEPGSITESGTIATGTAPLELIDVQPEGKRPMPLDAYRRGHRWERGFRLESI
jgi:methionyl-tRNA formyltransferase